MRVCNISRIGVQGSSCGHGKLFTGPHLGAHTMWCSDQWPRGLRRRAVPTQAHTDIRAASTFWAKLARPHITGVVMVMATLIICLCPDSIQILRKIWLQNFCSNSTQTVTNKKNCLSQYHSPSFPLSTRSFLAVNLYSKLSNICNADYLANHLCKTQMEIEYI